MSEPALVPFLTIGTPPLGRSESGGSTSPVTHAGARGALMASEMAEQPAVLAHLLRDGVAEIRSARAAIEKFRPRFVMLAGRGTSDHAALYAKYLIEVRRSLPAGLASPSTLTIYGARPELSGVLFLAISQSGSSPDLIGSVEVARACGALTIAVTNDASSPLAAVAAYHVDMLAGVERAVAATKTYTAELLALYLLLSPRVDLPTLIARLPDAAAQTLSYSPSAHAAAGRYRFAHRLVMTARGFSYPTAREASLKLMETSYLSAQAFSGADLLHGPLAMLDPDMPVIAIVSPGPGGAAMAPVIARMLDAGVDVLRVGDPDGLAVEASGISDDLLPILEILPLQQLAWRLALDRGGDPDRPRGLSKVTETW